MCVCMYVCVRARKVRHVIMCVHVCVCEYVCVCVQLGYISVCVCVYVCARARPCSLTLRVSIDFMSITCVHTHANTSNPSPKFSVRMVYRYPTTEA